MLSLECQEKPKTGIDEVKEKSNDAELCPLCFERPQHQVYSCVECDYWLCVECKNRIRDCPQCRTSLRENPMRRNRAVEKILNL